MYNVLTKIKVYVIVFGAVSERLPLLTQKMECDNIFCSSKFDRLLFTFC